ncbi:haloacid dehalogenase [Terrihabitans soli]|uniref:Haloacid dehalogenase n=1 Tax=Terrihabitans soli TaxID=708113 RepID=A0A6S6QZ24_9HYPH|nr:haloacid dehalogenase [Terrihabitans soli]
MLEGANRVPLIRLFISDVDGTLVRHDKSLTDATVAAFGRLRAAGIKSTLISARPPSGILHLAEALAIDGPLGAFNGGTLVRRDGTVSDVERLDPDLVAKLLAVMTRPGIDIWLFSGGLWYARTDDNPHTPREILSAGVKPTLRPIAEMPVRAVDKIVGVSDDAALLIEVEADAKAAAGGRATIARSQAYFLDVTAVKANKGDGVTALARVCGVPLDEVAVIGDQANDLPMFAKAGVSIAMGQAPDAVKAAADAVTASNDEDGVAVAIDRILGGGLERKGPGF